MINLHDYPANPFYSWYDIKTTFRGRPVTVYVSGEASESVDALNIRANNGLKWIDEHMDVILDYSVAELIEIKNNHWVNDTHPEITADEFKRRLDLESIRFRDNATIEITFRDGGIFWGHWVVIYTDKDYNFIRANIEG